MIAVGTTSLRALEASGGEAGRSETDIFITPGYRFRVVDALLTSLIVESYDALGDEVERAESVVPRADYGDRYRAVGRATRAWAVAEPQQWALIYGSPLPGYAAPQDTVAPAIRAPLVLTSIV